MRVRVRGTRQLSRHGERMQPVRAPEVVDRRRQ
jgi:hypothetical protein